MTALLTEIMGDREVQGEERYRKMAVLHVKIIVQDRL